MELTEMTNRADAQLSFEDPSTMLWTLEQTIYFKGKDPVGLELKAYRVDGELIGLWFDPFSLPLPPSERVEKWLVAMSLEALQSGYNIVHPDAF